MNIKTTQHGVVVETDRFTVEVRESGNETEVGITDNGVGGRPIIWVDDFPNPKGVAHAYLHLTEETRNDPEVRAVTRAHDNA